MQIYVVKTGDTVYRLASAYGVTAESIIETNQIAYPYRLVVGQALLIPGEDRAPKRGILSGGYAYPFIRPELLEETLPYLSRLLVFSYGFTEEGRLLAPELPDAWMIQAAKEARAEAFLTLTPFGADGNFNNQLIHRMLIEPKAREQLISELLWTVEQKGFRRVDVDFEFILA